MTASSDKTARIWDTRFASGLTGDALVEAICREKLIGAERFTPEDLLGANLPEPPPENPVATCLALLEQRRAQKAAAP